MTSDIIPEVLVTPQPFKDSFTIEIESTKNLNVIVTLLDEKGRIDKMFGWFLVNGANITKVENITSAGSGDFRINISDTEATLLHSMRLERGV